MATGSTFPFVLDTVRLNRSPPAEVLVVLKSRSRSCEKMLLVITTRGLDAESSNCSQQIIR